MANVHCVLLKGVCVGFSVQRGNILPIIFSEVEVEKKELFEILPLLITSLTVVEKNETNDEKGCLPQGR